MSPELVQEFSAIAQTIVAIATFILALIILWQAKRERRAEMSQAVIDCWNVVNALALTNDDALKILDNMLDPSTKDDPVEKRRKRWIAFTAISALEMSYLGSIYGVLDKNYSKQILKQLLPHILLDEDYYSLIQTRGYHPSFVKYCREIKVESQKGKYLPGKISPDGDLLMQLLNEKGEDD